MNEQQGGLLSDQRSDRSTTVNSLLNVKGQELNNRMIYSGDTKDLSALLSHNSSPAIKDLLQKKVIDKYGLGLKNDTEFVVDDETIARYSNI